MKEKYTWQQKYWKWFAKNPGLNGTITLEGIYIFGVLMGIWAGYYMGYNALIRKIGKVLGENKMGSIIFNKKCSPKGRAGITVRSGWEFDREVASDNRMADLSNAITESIARGIPVTKLTELINEGIKYIEKEYGTND